MSASHEVQLYELFQRVEELEERLERMTTAWNEYGERLAENANRFRERRLAFEASWEEGDLVIDDDVLPCE